MSERFVVSAYRMTYNRVFTPVARPIARPYSAVDDALTPLYRAMNGQRWDMLLYWTLGPSVLTKGLGSTQKADQKIDKPRNLPSGFRCAQEHSYTRV